MRTAICHLLREKPAKMIAMRRTPLKETVVVTGMGAITPLGLDAPTTWQALTEGRSGVGRITLFDSSPLKTHIAAEVKNYDPTKYFEPKEARRLDRFAQFAMIVAAEASCGKTTGSQQRDSWRRSEFRMPRLMTATFLREWPLTAAGGSDASN